MIAQEMIDQVCLMVDAEFQTVRTASDLHMAEAEIGERLVDLSPHGDQPGKRVAKIMFERVLPLDLSPSSPPRVKLWSSGREDRRPDRECLLAWPFTKAQFWHAVRFVEGRVREHEPQFSGEGVDRVNVQKPARELV